MSIAIYGDSFADSGNNAQAWPKLLEEILNTNIDNFAVSASSAVYSYSVFLKNYKNYEKNIFVLTHSNRFSFFDNFNHVWTTRISNINETIEHNTQRYNYNLSNVDKKIYKNKMFEVSHYPNNQKIYIQSIIDSLKFNDPNILLLHAFDDFTKSNLKNIQSLDYHYHFEDKNKAKYYGVEDNKLRPCHMSLKQNKEFANYLEQHIKGNLDINEIISKDNINQYFTITKDLSKTGILV